MRPEAAESPASTGVDHLSVRLVHTYDLYRTALLSSKYYAARLAARRRTGTFFDAVIALSAPGAAGGWAIWKDPPISYLWACVAGMAVVLSVLKPILGLQRSIERYSKIWAQYNDLTYHLETLISSAQARRGWTEEMERSLTLAQKKFRDLAGEEDPYPNRKKMLQLQEEVHQELPVDSLWMPQA